MVPAEREKGSKIERDKQTLRPKQIGHLCLKYKNKYIIENNKKKIGIANKISTK